MNVPSPLSVTSAPLARVIWRAHIARIAVDTRKRVTGVAVGVGVVGQGVAGGEAQGRVFIGGAEPSSLAVGPSLVPVIVIVTVAVSVPPLPSLIV